nr:ulp1 protease family, C-terminal catalytic domain-containing protein [Tanacetum cinerariifolium]
LRFPDCVKLNELNKKFQEDFCNKNLARNEDAEDANVANPSEAANVAQASPTEQVSRAAIFHASPIRMTKKAAKRTDVNKLNVEYTKDKSNNEDNEDSHSAEEEQNTEDSESVKTPPVKKHGRPKKLSWLMIVNHHLLKDEKKCLDEMGFGSMIEMGIHELSGKLVKKFEEDFKKKDLVKNDENDDTTATTNDKNDLLHFDSKMESDSPASDDDNQNSVDDDGKQDVVMDEIDKQNKEDVCKEARSIRENKCVGIQLTFKRHAWRKKSVMDNENKDAEAVELSSSIKRHPMKHSYNLDVKDNGDQTVGHNDSNEDTGNTDLDFVDIRHEQNNDDSELSNNADAKSENEDEEFDALAITICNVCHPVPLRVLMPNENINDFLEIINIEDSESEKEEFDFGGDTDNEEKYDPKKDVDYKGEFYKSPYELKPIEPKIRKLYLKRMKDSRKDYDKTMRKYCFKTRFLQANFLDKNVDANMKVKNFEKKLKEAVNNDTALMKLQQIQFKMYIKEEKKSNSKKKNINSFVCNDYDDSIDEVDPNIIVKEVVKDINKSSAENTKDNSNDEDNEDSHSAKEEQNTEDSDSVKTPPVKNVVFQRKLSGIMRIKRHLLKDEGDQGKTMMNRKSKQLVQKEKEENTKMKNKDRNEDVHHILNEDDKVDDSCPAVKFCSVIEGDEVNLSEVEDVEKEKQQIGNEDDIVVDDSDTAIPNYVIEGNGVKFIENDNVLIDDVPNEMIKCSFEVQKEYSLNECDAVIQDENKAIDKDSVERSEHTIEKEKKKISNEELRSQSLKGNVGAEVAVDSQHTIEDIFKEDEQIQSAEDVGCSILDFDDAKLDIYNGLDLLSPYEYLPVDVKKPVLDVEKIVVDTLFAMIGSKLGLIFESQSGLGLNHLEMETLTPTLMVSAYVIDVWTELLNILEIYKDESLPLRYFFKITVY